MYNEKVYYKLNRMDNFNMCIKYISTIFFFFTELKKNALTLSIRINFGLSLDKKTRHLIYIYPFMEVEDGLSLFAGGEFELSSSLKQDKV